MNLDKAFHTFPRLETQRLLLRRITNEDAAALFDILSDEEVTSYYDDDPFMDLSQAHQQIQAWQYGYQNRAVLRWAITNRTGGALIGSCGYYGFHTWHQRASIGYELARPNWQQGIMTEALRAILDFGYRELGLNRVQAFVMPGNTASINMLLKLGFRNEGVLVEYERWGSKGFVDLCIFALLRKKWQES